MAGTRVRHTIHNTVWRLALLSQAANQVAPPGLATACISGAANADGRVLQ